METTLNFEGKTYQLDLSRLYRYLITEEIMVEVKPKPKPDEPSTGPIKQPEPEQPDTEPIKQPDPVVVPDPAKLTANAVEPVKMLVGIPVAYRIPESAFSGPVESVDVSDLPAGLSYNSATRTISGTPATTGQYQLIVTAVSGEGITRQLVQAPLMLSIILESSGEIPVPDRPIPQPIDPETSADTSMITETGTATYQGKSITYLLEDNG